MVSDTQTKMLSRDGTETGTIVKMRCYKCRMEGCTGWRIQVKWPEGNYTYPCSKSTRIVDKDTLQII